MLVFHEILMNEKFRKMVENLDEGQKSLNAFVIIYYYKEVLRRTHIFSTKLFCPLFSHKFSQNILLIGEMFNI